MAQKTLPQSLQSGNEVTDDEIKALLRDAIESQLQADSDGEPVCVDSIATAAIALGIDVDVGSYGLVQMTRDQARAACAEMAADIRRNEPAFAW